MNSFDVFKNIHTNIENHPLFKNSQEGMRELIKDKFKIPNEFRDNVWIIHGNSYVIKIFYTLFLVFGELRISKEIKYELEI